MIFSFLFIYIFVVNIVYYVVHIVCEVDVIANSLVLYLPFCSTLNKNFFSLFFFSSSSSHPYTYQRPAAVKNYHQLSFYPRTINQWNSLLAILVCAPTVDAFSSVLRTGSYTVAPILSNSNLLLSWGRKNICNSLCWCGWCYMICYLRCRVRCETG